MPDIGIPIAFPDYQIAVPKLGEIGGLGHAGVLIIKDSGFTLYLRVRALPCVWSPGRCSQAADC
jgi:hypothetical protein